MRVGVVDIGTNSMRMLITDGHTEERLVEVTGLGRGVDRTGSLGEYAMAATLPVLESFGERMGRASVSRRRVIATSASRDAANAEAFFDRCELALGARPEIISGAEEARLAYEGALIGLEVGGPVVVSDIGGGSTEFVWEDSEVSIDIGSVRLSDRVLTDRPPPISQLKSAESLVGSLFGGIPSGGDTLVGVAGTWTSIAAIDLGDPGDRPGRGRGHVLARNRLDRLVDRLAGLSVEETAGIPGLDPRRAPVMLAGAVVAAGVMSAVGAEEATVSWHDTLDGVAARLLALA